MEKKLFGKFIPLDVAATGAETLLLLAESGEKFSRGDIEDWLTKFYFEVHLVSEEANHDAE